ncbi:MAG: hypothetical protein V4563_17535 [Pseudomonadota bacterium]
MAKDWIAGANTFCGMIVYAWMANLPIRAQAALNLANTVKMKAITNMTRNRNAT